MTDSDDDFVRLDEVDNTLSAGVVYRCARACYLGKVRKSHRRDHWSSDGPRLIECLHAEGHNTVERESLERWLENNGGFAEDGSVDEEPDFIVWLPRKPSGPASEAIE